MATLKARIIKAKRILKVYRENHSDYKNSPKEPDTQAIGDMVADLMLLYKKLREDPSRLISVAMNHYLAEHQHEVLPSPHNMSREEIIDELDELEGVGTLDEMDDGALRVKLLAARKANA